MRINNNISAMNTYSRLTSAQGAQGKSLEKLSSGLRINRAGDDAAGLAISEKMRGQIKGLNQAVRNAQDGISLIQTAEGALNETQSILQRMRELSVQASNDTATLDDRKEIQKEINQLIDEVDRIGNETEFNTKALLSGDYESTPMNFHIGANKGQAIDVRINDMRTSALGTQTGAGITSTGSIKTNYSGSNDAKITFTQGGNTLDVVLNADYGSADGVVNAINTAIENDANLAGQVQAKSIGDGKVTFVNLTNSAVTIAEASTPGTTTAASSLNITVGAIGNTATSVNSKQVTDVDNSASGGVLTQSDANNSIEVFDDAIKQVSAERAKLGAVQNRLDHTINNLTTTSENLSAAESRIRDVDMAKEMMEFTKNNILNQASTAMLAQANQMPQGVLQLLG